MTSGNCIKIKYFASLREQLETSQEAVSISGPLTLAGLRAQLMARGGVWADAFTQTPGLRASVNQEISPMDRVLSGGDEVAFFPPVTGG